MAVTWQSWSDAIASSVRSVPDGILEKAARVVCAARIVVTAGNGGSASLASHMAQAVAKPDYAPGGRAAVCLTDHVPTLTAHANDGGWQDALVESARPFLDKDACLVLFSSSGRSENVVRLARLAQELRVPIVAFTGFSGGPLRQLATVSVHVDSDDYEVIEPVHSAFLHRVQWHIREISGRT